MDEGPKTGRVAVRDLADHEIAWLLDVQGRGAVRAPPGQMRCHGFGCPYPRPFSGVFLLDDTLLLQVGGRRWRVADIVKLRQLHDWPRTAKYEMEMSDGELVRVTIAFPFRTVVNRAISPIYDEMESWSDDPMKLLPYRDRNGGLGSGDTQSVQEWAERVTPRWKSGV